MKEKEEWKILSMEQLMVLAAGMGIRQFIGLEVAQIPEMTEESYIQLISQMRSDGLLIQEGKHVAVSAPWQSIFRQVRFARTVLVCYPSDENMQQCCCYCGDRVTVMESDAGEGKRIRVRDMSYRELGEYLTGDVYFPGELPEVPEGFLQGEREQDFDKSFPPVEQVIQQKETYLIMDALHPETGITTGRIRVTQDPFGYGLIYQGEKELRRFYQREYMLRYLDRLLEGRMVTDSEKS